MLLVLMQNGWSSHYTRIGRPDEPKMPNRDRVWSRNAWLSAAWGCKTGRVLKQVIHLVPEEDIWLDNTTLELADTPEGRKSPDIDHVVGVLHDRGIEAVLACGKQAGEAIDRCWRGPLVKMPHPAYRGLGRQGIVLANQEVASMRLMGRIRSVFRAEVLADGQTRFLDGDITTGWDEPWITQPQLTSNGGAT